MPVAGRYAMLIGLVCLIGCTAQVATDAPNETRVPTPPPTPSRSPSPIPSPTPRSEPTDSPRSGPRIEIVGDTPVFRPTDIGDYGATLSAAYIVDDGTHHAYVVAFAQLPGRQRVHHLTSEDGLAWVVDENDPFERLGLDFSPPGPVPGSVIETDDGWAMYFWGVPPTSTQRSSIYRATADSAAGPWVADPEPVFEPGAAGAWDDLALDFPAVVATDDGYEMLYSAVGTTRPGTSSIGVASSADGIGWTREADPVIDAGDCGPADAGYAAMPRLLETADGYLALFDADRTTAAARSTDLLSWACVGEGEILSYRDVPGGSGGIHSFSVARDGERISLLVESLVEGGSNMWLGEAVELE